MPAESIAIEGDAGSASRLFVVFSDDWGVHMSSSQHIFRHVARYHRVVWINTVGMRAPTLSWSDFRKARRKLKGMLGLAAAAPPSSRSGNVRVHQPMMLPFNDRFVSRFWNRRAAARAMRNAIREAAAERVVIVTTVPNACEYVDAVPSEQIVYYCVDDFSEWPGLDKSRIEEMEQILIEKADVCVATSQNLQRKLASAGKPTHLLTHGVDIELFSSDPPGELGALAGIPEPRVGFFGLFDERSDQELIALLADRLPDLSFVIAGKVETSVSGLADLGNVHFLGDQPYEQLPALIKGLRVLIIPYRVNSLSRSLSPLKLKEYLVTGRPVVSTPIAAAQEMGDDVAVASGIDEWCPAIRAALDANIDERRRDQVSKLRDESWANKARSFVAICAGGEVGAADGGACAQKRVN